MKTVRIKNSYVRVSAIESITHILKDKRDYSLIVVQTQQNHYQMSFETDGEAIDFMNVIVDLMNE